MRTFVIDASVAVKWVVEEEGTEEALKLRRQCRLIAPELLAAEAANVLWKKVRRGEINAEEALLAARLLQAAGVEYVAAQHLLAEAARIAIEIDHAAYDALYVALAAERGCRLVTADERLVRKLGAAARGWLRGLAIGLRQAESEIAR